MELEYLRVRQLRNFMNLILIPLINTGMSNYFSTNYYSINASAHLFSNNKQFTQQKILIASTSGIADIEFNIFTS